MAHGFTWHGGFDVLACLADEGAQLLGVRVRALNDPLAKGVVFTDQAVAPGLGQVQHQVVLRRATGLLRQGRAHGFQHLGLNLAHELANELHLAALALKVGDALGLGHGVFQLFGQVQLGDELGPQRQQVFPQLLQFVTLTLHVRATLVVRAFEFAFEFEIALAAFSDEFASNKIAFFEFA